MQIQQVVQNILATSHALPTQVFNELAAGKQLEAVVVKVAPEAQVATLKLGDTVLDIRTSIPVEAGQKVLVELDNSSGKAVLKISPALQTEQLARVSPQLSSVLNLGQQVAVEVVKVLAENKILVELKPNQLSNPLVQAKVPSVQIEVDTSKLAKQFTVGERALLEVLSIKPLSVALKAQPVVREQAIIERIQQLLTEQPKTVKPNLIQFSQLGKTQALPSTVQREINNLLTHIIEKQHVNRPQVLKQAIEHSGSFTERLLLQQSKGAGVEQDFKANISKLISSIEKEVDQYKKAITTSVESKAGPLKPTNQNAGLQVSQSVNKPLVSPFASSQGTRILSPDVALSNSNQQNQAQLNVNSGRVTQNASGVSEQANTHTLKPLTSPFAPQKQSVEPQTKTTTSSLVPTASSPSLATEREMLKTQTVVSAPQTQARPISSQALAPLSALIQASLAHSTTRPSVSVLNSPPQGAASHSATSIVDTVLTTPNQALALAKMLSLSISSEQVRGLQMDLLVLQNLLKDVESIQTRVQLNQFSMLKEPDTQTAPTASWLLDIPLKDKNDVDLLQLQIDQHSKHGDEDGDNDDIWNVQLRLDTQNLGPLQATLTMHMDDIKLVLRAEKEESIMHIERYIDVLRQSLADIGVSLSSITCLCGEVSKSSLTERYLSETSSLVDISV